MTYLIQMQYLPGWDIWVSQLSSTDPIYVYDTEAEALAKMTELQNNDTSGREYRIVTQ